MYVVVVIGETARVPMRATLPIPLSILTVSAFSTFQLSVAVSPISIVMGKA